MHHIAFKWEISVGQVLQLVVVALSVVGLYYGLVIGQNENRMMIESNTEAIKSNSEAIKQVIVARKEALTQLRREAELREQRIMGSVTEIKENVNWLVRREAEGAD